jgi:hypothetical protein
MPQVEGGSATVGTPSSGGGGGGDKLTNALVKAVAVQMGISPAKAKSLIVAYHKEHGGTWASAVQGAVLGGGGGGGSDTSGGGGGSSSSSGGSSSGGGSSGPSPETIANAKASYANLLRSWGIPITPAMNQFVTQAATSGMGSAAFLQQVRQTKAYAQVFKGIMMGNGTLRMSESQYIAGYNSAKDYAASVGRNLSTQAYGLAIKNGNSPSEIKEKIQALDSLRTNKDVLQQFNEYLAAKGLVGPKGMTREEALRFIMRQGPVQWEQEWNIASQAAQLAKLGVDVGKPKTGSDLSYKELKNLQGNLAPDEQPNYQALAEALKAIPYSQLYGYGLTRKDVTKLAYNAPGADQIAEVATRALAQYRTAVTEPGAQPNLTQGPSGTQMLTGRRPTQASE